MERSVKYMFMASILFALMNILVKYLDNVPVAQIVFMRSFVMLLIVYVLLRKRNIKARGTQKKLLILRGVFGSAGIALFFYTLHNMPLASAVVLHYLTPIFTAMIAFLFASERLHPTQFVFFMLCFGGVLLIKGFDSRINTLTLVLGIVGTIAAASAYNIISYIKGSEHHLVIMFYFPFVTIPLVLVYIFLTGDWIWTNLFEWVLLVAVGLLTYGAQYFLTRAYQDGAVNKVSVISYMGIVYALLLGYFLFDEWYNWKALMGVLMVLVGVLLNIFYKPGSQTSLFAKRDHGIESGGSKGR